MPYSQVYFLLNIFFADSRIFADLQKKIYIQSTNPQIRFLWIRWIERIGLDYEHH